VSSALLNTIGQVINLLGILTLFVFGMPYRLRTGGADIVTVRPTESGKRGEALYGLLSWIGLGLTVVGVAIQIFANFKLGSSLT
jgi:hypothetical protein